MTSRESDEVMVKFFEMCHSTDPELLRLPQPRRVELAGLVFHYPEALGDNAGEFLRLVRDRTRTRHEAMLPLLDANDGDLPHISGTTNAAVFEGIVTPARYFEWGGRIVRVEDSLNELLKQTDLGLEAPCFFARIPYPAVFVEFGTSRQHDPRFDIENTESGLHAVEGAYVSEVAYVVGEHGPATETQKALGLKDGERCRILEITIFGSPVGKSGLLDDASLFFSLIIRDKDEDRPLGGVLQEQLALYDRVGSGFVGYEPLSASSQLCIEANVDHLMKALLVMNTDAVTKSENIVFTDIKRQWERAGEKKRHKIERRMARAYDFIAVRCASNDDGTVPSHAVSRGVAPHWRRGHIRRQRVGENRAQTRLVWIKPCLVHGDMMATPPLRNYELRK